MTEPRKAFDEWMNSLGPRDRPFFESNESSTIFEAGYEAGLEAAAKAAENYMSRDSGAEEENACQCIAVRIRALKEDTTDA